MEITFNHRWKEIEGMNYELTEAFTNSLTCKYAFLENTYPWERMPRRDKLIKKNCGGAYLVMPGNTSRCF